MKANKGLIFYVMFYVMGCFGTLGWFVHLFFIINASLNNGIVILIFTSGEIFVLILLCSSLFLFSLFMTLFLAFKTGKTQKVTYQ